MPWYGTIQILSLEFLRTSLASAMFGQVGTICVPTLFFLFTAMTCHPPGAASQATLGSHYHDLPLGSHYQHPLPVQPILGRMSDVLFV